MSIRAGQAGGLRFLHERSPQRGAAAEGGCPRLWGSAKRRLYLGLDGQSDAAGWQQALEVAHKVYYAAAEDRPFPQTTRHFYSERSMVGGRTPAWAKGKTPVQPVRFRPDPRRFRFYSAIAAATVIG